MPRLKDLIILLLLASCSTANSQVINKYCGNYTSGYGGDGGQATNATLHNPAAFSDKMGNVYIADFSNNVVRKVNASGIISTFAGNNTPGYSGDGGQATAAQLNHPTHVATDGAGNVYIADAFNNVIRKVSASGTITTVAGNTTPGYSGDGGPATSAELDDPNGVWANAAGNIYIADSHNNVIRKVNTSGTISTIIGNGYNAGTTNGGYSGDGGQATDAELFYPESVTMDDAGNFYVAELYNSTVRKVNTSGIISTIAGTNVPGYSGDNGPANAAQLSHPYDVAINSIGTIYIADQTNNVIRSIDTSGIIHTYAGNHMVGNTGDGGTATAAELNTPLSVSVDQNDNLYIGDFANNVIRVVSPASSSVSQPASVSEELRVSPNPTTGAFTFELHTGIRETAHVVITNTVGQTIREFTAATDRPIEVNMDAASGMYLITATTLLSKGRAKIVVR